MYHINPQSGPFVQLRQADVIPREYDRKPPLRAVYFFNREPSYNSDSFTSKRFYCILHFTLLYLSILSQLVNGTYIYEYCDRDSYGIKRWYFLYTTLGGSIICGRMRKLRTKQLILIMCIVSVFVISRNITVPYGSYQLEKYFSQSMTVKTNSSVKTFHSVFEETTTKKPMNKTQVANTLSDGYNLAQRMRAKCTNPSKPNIVSVFEKYESPSGDTQICPIWKIGTTFLKRIFMIKTQKQYNDFINPYDIPFDVFYRAKKGMLMNDDKRQRFMFVRDPYKRLLSGYVDKLLAPNPVYWDIISRRATKAVRKNATTLSLQCGHDLEFYEYVKYVILALTPGHNRIANRDGHYNEMWSMCKPCAVKYDFVGKMETFGVDSMEVVKRLNMPGTQELLEIKGASLAADDAIQDTCNQPYDENFIKGYSKCITLYEALQRAWKKLQTRGLIGKQALPFSENEAQNISHTAFLQMARDAHQATPSSEKKQMQRDYFLKMFATVSLEDLEKIRQIYAEDFKLFEYDDRPSVLFDR